MEETPLKPSEFRCPKCGAPNKHNALSCWLCQTVVFCKGKKAEKVEKRLRKRTDFYKQIRANKRKSFILIFFLALFLCGIGYLIGETYYPGGGFYGIASAGILTLILSSVAYFKGHSIVLTMCGAKEASLEADRQLMNVVEEMSIASGLPLPKVYIIEDDSMNAFAAGRDPRHSVVAVTRGLLNNLNREEIQAVIGHEMGHIRNFDIRFAMLIAVIVGVIGIMSHFFLRGLSIGGRGRVRGGKGNIVQLGFLLVGVALAIIAPILATIIQMAISRQREFMADATSVEFTRNPHGLISALKKLAGNPVKVTGASKATQHLFIVNPFKNFGERSWNLFSTHPPIEARIRVLESMVV